MPDACALSRLVHYAQKRFQLPLLASGLTDGRSQPEIPLRSVILSLVLGDPRSHPQECRRAGGQKDAVLSQAGLCRVERAGVERVLDFEPMRQGEEECAAALRLLRQMRATHGLRFFDVVVVDACYAGGPFLRTVVEELGWPVVAVLKQERFEVHQEALALSREKPGQGVERNGRCVEIWNVPSLRFSDK